ncbi:MAG: hypothetical protein [Microvirus sp.]|nr:MAG: hypothetical protein [Microvirus sp.]
MILIINHSNYPEYKQSGGVRSLGEIYKKPSKTVPDMALSLKDLLERYVRGEDVVTLQPVYTDDQGIPDGIENLSPIEKLALKGEIQDYVEEIRTNVRSRAFSTPPLDTLPAPEAAEM